MPVLKRVLKILDLHLAALFDRYSRKEQLFPDSKYREASIRDFVDLGGARGLTVAEWLDSDNPSTVLSRYEGTDDD